MTVSPTSPEGAPSSQPPTPISNNLACKDELEILEWFLMLTHKKQIIADYLSRLVPAERTMIQLRYQRLNYAAFRRPYLSFPILIS